MAEIESTRVDTEGCFILSNGRTIQNVAASKKMLKLMNFAVIVSKSSIAYT